MWWNWRSKSCMFLYYRRYTKKRLYFKDFLMFLYRRICYNTCIYGWFSVLMLMVVYQYLSSFRLFFMFVCLCSFMFVYVHSYPFVMFVFLCSFKTLMNEHKRTWTKEYFNERTWTRKFVCLCVRVRSFVRLNLNERTWSCLRSCSFGSVRGLIILTFIANTWITAVF